MPLPMPGTGPDSGWSNQAPRALIMQLESMPPQSESGSGREPLPAVHSCSTK